MRLIVLALLLVHISYVVCYDNAANGVTILKPTTNGDSTRGVTVMTPGDASSASTSPCSTGNCATASRPMIPAIVDGPHCGCEEEEECGCRKKQYVAPELKSNCGCQGQDDCPCSRKVFTRDSCGCLHEAVCPCRTTVTADSCGCLHLVECSCRKMEYVRPEIKSDTCGCQDRDEACDCTHFRPN